MNKPVFSFVVIALFVLSVVYATTFAWLLTLAWQQPDYSHGLLLPPIVIYFLWGKRRELSHSTRSPTVADLSLGLLCLIVAVGLFAAGRVTVSEYTVWLSFFPAVLGLVAALIGTGVCRHLLAPLLILFLAKPFPDSLVPMIFNTFQTWTAGASVRLLEFFEAPVYLRGNVIELPRMTLLVEEACSGIRSLLALATVAAIFAVTMDWRVVTKLIALCAAIVLALLFNIIRVLGTATLVLWEFDSLAEGFFHSFSGLISFLLGFILLYYLGAIIDKGLKDS